MTGPFSAGVRLRTLGSVDLRAADGTQITAVLRQPKRLGLLVYLALSGPAFQRRDRLLALFWPEADERSARGSLSQAVFQLRAALGRNAILSRGDDDLALNPEVVWCDAVAFQQATQSGQAGEAMELYRGELLPSFTVAEARGFEDWLAQRRTELSAQAANACRELAESEERAGNFEPAVQWLRRGIAIQPFNESLHQRLIALLDHKGDRAAALQAFEALRGMVREEFGAEPAAETLELMQSVRARAPRGSVPTAPADTGEPPVVITQPTARRRRLRPATLVAAAAVVALAAGVLTLLWPSKAPDRLPLQHVAVLYFNDESPNHDLGYLSESLTSTLIDQLSQVPQLQVISQNGVQQFRAANIPVDSIARALDAGTLVGGSITRSQDRLRVTVALINGATGVALQSRTLERPMGELFNLLDDVSSEVAAFLRTTVGQQIRVSAWRSETRNVDAWRMLQQAEFIRSTALHADKVGHSPVETAALLAQADSLAQGALALDKHFVSALVLRGEIAHRRAWLSLVAEQPPEPAKWLRVADSLANAALALNQRSASALELRGVVSNSRWLLGKQRVGSDVLLDSAQKDLQTALTLGAEPARVESTLSGILYQQGRFAGARTAALRALAGDAYLSDADQIVNRLFQTSFELADDAEAGRWCDEVRHRFQGQWPSAYCDLLLLGWSREGNHDPRKAVHLLETFGAADPPPLRESMRPRVTALAAAVLARAGLRDSAQAMLARARAQAPDDVELLYCEAAARLQMNDDARALELLRTYLRLKPAARPFIRNSRIFARLRNQLG